MNKISINKKSWINIFGAIKKEIYTIKKLSYFYFNKRISTYLYLDKINCFIIYLYLIIL